MNQLPISESLKIIQAATKGVNQAVWQTLDLQREMLHIRFAGQKNEVVWLVKKINDTFAALLEF